MESRSTEPVNSRAQSGESEMESVGHNPSVKNVLIMLFRIIYSGEKEIDLLLKKESFCFVFFQQFGITGRFEIGDLAASR